MYYYVIVKNKNTKEIIDYKMIYNDIELSLYKKYFKNFKEKYSEEYMVLLTDQKGQILEHFTLNFFK